MSFRPSARRALAGPTSSRMKAAKAQRETLNKVARAVAKTTGPSAMSRALGPMPSLRTIGMKFKDLAVATYAMSTTGSITFIPDAIAVGAGENERLGSQIILHSLWCRGQAVAGSAGTVSTGTALFIWDKTPNLLLPAITDIINSANSNAFPVDAARRRFTTLKRLDFDFAGNSATPTADSAIQDVDFFLRLPKGAVVEYKDSVATTGAITTVVSGALYLVTVGITAAGTGAPNLTVGFRTRFANPQ